MTLEQLKAKRSYLLYTVRNKISARLARETSRKFKTHCSNEAFAYKTNYENVFAILSGKINSLDFVIQSIENETNHPQHVWDFEYTRALN